MTRATASNIRDTIKTIWQAKPKPWEIWPEGRPSGTPEDYCKALTGHSWEWLIATVADLTGDKEFSARTMVPAFKVADPTIMMGSRGGRGRN